jgi:hypothetical protein
VQSVHNGALMVDGLAHAFELVGIGIAPSLLV